LPCRCRRPRIAHFQLFTTESPANNPYSAPQSDLAADKVTGEVPSISEALSRGYDFSINDVLREAWEKINGYKGVLLGASVATYALMFLINMVAGFFGGLLGAVATTNPVAVVLVNMLVSILAGMLAYPLMTGVLMLGILRAGDQPFQFSTVFSSLSQFVPLMLTALLMNAVIYVPMGILAGLAALVSGGSLTAIGIAGFIWVIYATYLGISYTLALPLAFERGLSPWQALETSRKAIGQHWFKVLGLLLCIGILVSISAIPLFIGLVWTIPLSIVAIGVLYRTIFGVLPPAN